jgi:hypothetical protein
LQCEKQAKSKELYTPGLFKTAEYTFFNETLKFLDEKVKQAEKFETAMASLKGNKEEEKQEESSCVFS